MAALIDDLTTLLVSNSRRSINDNLNWVMLSNGAADPNDNVIFFGFEGKATVPSFVAKVPRLPSNGRILREEYDRLVEVWGLLGKDASLLVPEPLAFFDVGQQQVSVISFVRGDGLLFSSKKKLWHDPIQVLNLSKTVAGALRELHEKTAKEVADVVSIPTDFLENLELFKKIYTPTAEESLAFSELEQYFARHSVHYQTLLHGDFWHGNIIRSSQHGTLIFVDWQHSRWSSDVSADVYMFLMAGALSASRGSPEERASLTAKLLVNWQQEIFPAYLAAYGPTERYSLLPPRLGMQVCCIEKAVRSIRDFGYNQFDDLIWRNLLTELVNIPKDGFLDGS